MAKTTSTGFVVCLRNEGADDLEVRKVYSVIPDDNAFSRGFLRVIDESGEDYLYPEELFAWIEVSEATAMELRSTSAKQ